MIVRGKEQMIIPSYTLSYFYLHENSTYGNVKNRYNTNRFDIYFS